MIVCLYDMSWVLHQSCFVCVWHIMVLYQLCSCLCVTCHVMLCYMCLVNCVMVIISHKCYKNKTDCRGLEVHTASWQWTLLSDFKYFCCFAVSNLTNYHLIIIYKSNKVIYRHIWTTNINNIVYIIPPPLVNVPYRVLQSWHGMPYYTRAVTREKKWNTSNLRIPIWSPIIDITESDND